MAYTSASGPIYAGIFKKTAHVFIESGQSNSQGRGLLADSPIADGSLVGSVKTWRRNINGGDMYSGAGAWYGLEYDTNQYEARNEFGSVLKFAMNLRDNLEDADNGIYIIKADGNGKDIDGWLLGGDDENERTAMYAGHITPALASLVSLVNDGTYNEIRIHGFFWDQGEGDSSLQVKADAYQANLTTHIADVRAAVGIPTLPFRMRRMESSFYTYTSTVQSAQEAVAAADARVSIINGPWTYTDTIHIDGTSQNSVGDARYTLLNSMTQGQVYNG